jgi:hypothetical protein
MPTENPVMSTEKPAHADSKAGHAGVTGFVDRESGN